MNTIKELDNMKTFLEYVAQDIINKYGTNLSDIAIVFPNKRASLFMNENLARLSDTPLWAPAYITISDLFRQQSSLLVGDPIKLICDLHKTFVACTGIDETLDHFYGWGQLLIADFDDVDKNMADASKLFANLRDIHELDDISYLTEDQKEIIKKFFSNFSDDHNSELKKRFLQLWSNFLNIYRHYNEKLSSQGIAYEGKLYREVAEKENLNLPYRKYLFVGFNLMQKVELRLCDRLLQEGKAAFYWDFDDYYMTDRSEAGHYIRQYLIRYPNELAEMPHEEIYSNMSRQKDITFASAATETIQARYVSEWLRQNSRMEGGKKTAIVLADEKLLQTVVHSLPKDIESVNITIGYPLQQTPFYGLVRQLICLQGMGHPKGSNAYRLHYVNQVLRHPYIKYLSSNLAGLINNLTEHKSFFPTRESLMLDGDEGLELLFRDLESSENYNLALVLYLTDILKRIAQGAKDVEDPLFQESLFRTYTLLKRLHDLIASGDLEVDVITLERLIQQLMQSTSIPFHGEPAVGIQIMGILETRNLDFDHVLLLSCNEGNLPKGVNDSSFIPYSLRKAFGLTTVDNKVAIFAYYFYRLLQRAEDITFTYNSSTENGHTGEMSRFMLQLMVESKYVINRVSLTARQVVTRPNSDTVDKTDDCMRQLAATKLLTPTFLNSYLRCPKRFYYRYIMGLQEPDLEDEDIIDNRMFGNLFHRAAQLFYLSLAGEDNVETDSRGEQTLRRPIVVQRGDIEQALQHDDLLYQLVDEAFREQLFKVEKHAFRPDYNGLQLINREVIVSYLRQLLQIDASLTPFTIKGLEMVVSTPMTFNTATGEQTFSVGGFIDRLDEVDIAEGAATPCIRVIDYKTGRAPQSHPRTVGDIFDTAELARHTDYYLQAMLYSIIVKHSQAINPAREAVSPALLFIQDTGGENYKPTLKMAQDYMDDITAYEEEFMAGIRSLVAEIMNPDIPFVATSDRQRCASCPYASLCQY